MMIFVSSLLFLYLTLERMAGQTAMTRYGALLGSTMVSRSGRVFMAFSGVPYARPPTGKYRFEPPRSLQTWSGFRLARQDGPYCLQLELDGTLKGVEDCLYMTIYTHNISRRAPVLVHFHGGDFSRGNGALSYKPNFMMDENIVIVDVNYRLGLLGFLSLNSSEVSGNMGLKDQAAALKWIQENIGAFGGQANQVTIAGEAAGGTSVALHLVSPLSKGLFHRAVAESGTGYNLCAVGEPVNGDTVLQLANCSQNYLQTSIECLKNANISDLLLQIHENNKIYKFGPDSIFFRPILEDSSTEGAFLNGPLSDWSHAKVPLLLGMTSGEGLLRTRLFLSDPEDFNNFCENFDEQAPLYLGYYDVSSQSEDVTKKIKEFYFSNNNISMKDWVNITKLFTDSMFTNGIVETAQKHNSISNVYLYYFDYNGKYSIANSTDSFKTPGAFHTDEMLYLWYKDNIDLKDADLRLSKRLVKLWTHFARNGRPSPSRGRGFRWEPWGAKRKYLIIDNKGIRMSENLLGDRVDFWLNLSYKDLRP